MIKIENYSESQLADYLQSYSESQLKLTINNIKGQEKSYLQAIENSLGNLIHLKDLEIIVMKKCILFEMGYILISNTIKKLVNLTKLNIKIDSLCQLENSGLIALTNAIQSIPELKELELSIGNNNYVNSQSIKYLMSSIKGLNNLTKLKLCLEDITKNIEGENNISIWNEFYHLKQLEELSLSLNFQNIGEQDFLELLNQITLLKDLHKLEIILIKNDTGTFWLDKFIYSLSQLKKLKILIVDFNQIMLFNNSQINQLYSNICELQFLEELDLNYLQYQLLMEDNEQYIRFIGKLRNLTKISLYIRDNFAQTKDNQIIFGESLKQLSKLKNVYLTLGNLKYRFYDEFMIELSDAFQSMKSLNILNLNLTSYISQFGYKKLGETFQYLNNLEDLRMIFVKHQNVTDKSVLFHNIRFLKQLKNLELKIVDSTQNLDTGILFDSIQYLLNLESLELLIGEYFDRNPWFVDINILNSSLKKLTNLSKLKLNLFFQNLEDQKVIEEFIEAIKSLQNLNQLTISLQTGYEQDEQFEIVHCLKHLKNLKILEINVKLFTDYKINSFMESITNLKSLESLSICIDGDISSLNLIQILLALKQSTKLQNLNLSIQHDLNNSYNQQFSEACFNLQSLKVLKIIDENQNNSKEDPLLFYASGIKELKNLNKLYIACDQGQLTDVGAAKLAQALVNQQNLRSLSLRLECSSKISQKGETLLSKSMNQLKQLQKIKLELNCEGMLGNQIFNSSLSLNKLNQIFISSKQIFQTSYESKSHQDGIEKAIIDNELNSLVENELNEDIANQCNSQITDIILYFTIKDNKSDFLTELKHSISKINNLKYLNSLKLNIESIASSYLNLDLFNDFSKLSKINYLSIQTKKLLIERSTIENLKEGFQHTQNLEHLKIDINDPFDFDYLLMEGISNLKNLNSLEISICLSDKGAFCLGNSLINIKNLKNCQIKIEQSNNFSQEGLIYLENGLISLQNLDKLTFLSSNLYRDYQNNPSPQLGKFLNNMNKLNQLSLQIGKNNYCNSQGGNEVMKSLKSLTNLIQLNIRIDQNNQLDSENVSDFLENLHELKYLKGINLQIKQKQNEVILKSKFANIFNKRSKNCKLKIVFKQNHICLSFLNFSITIEHQLQSEIKIIDSNFFKSINNNIPIELVQYNYKSIPEFCEVLKQLHFKSINIRFQNLMSKEAYQKFCNVISSWQNAQILQIQCWLSFTDQDNNQIYLISESICELKSLLTLNLALFGIQEQQYSNLIKTLCKLQQLNEITIDIRERSTYQKIILLLQRKFKKLVILNSKNIQSQGYYVDG